MRLPVILLVVVSLVAQQTGNRPYNAPTAVPGAVTVTKGQGYGPGAAVIDSNGLLNAATGTGTNCVLVNGSSQPCVTGGDATSWGGVTISGTPALGYIPSATSATSATWQPAPTGGGGGALSVYFNTSFVGTRAALNILPSSGFLGAAADTGTAINLQLSADTAFLLSMGTFQAGAAVYVAPASASGTTYTACPANTFASLTKGMVFNFVPDVNSTGGATTLNLCILGATPLKLANGTSNPSSSSLAAGQMYTVWYDGTNFRLKDVTT